MVAVAGTVLITANPASTELVDSLVMGGIISPGDAAVLLAAFFYSLCTVRLSVLSKSYNSDALATGRILSKTVFAVVLLGVSLYQGNRCAQGPFPACYLGTRIIFVNRPPASRPSQAGS